MSIDPVCPLDLGATARRFTWWLLRGDVGGGSWAAPTAEAAGHLATGHVLDRGRWRHIGLEPDAGTPMLLGDWPLRTYVADCGSGMEPVSALRVAWGCTWERMPEASHVDVWQYSYRTSYREYAEMPELVWAKLLWQSALTIVDELALGRHVSHTTVLIRDLPEKQEVTLTAAVKWAWEVTPVTA